MVLSRWAMTKVVRSRHEPLQRLLHRLFRLGVQCRCGLIQDKDARVLQEGARDRDALALPAAELDPALADARIVALRHRLDEVVGVRSQGSRLDLPLGRIQLAVDDIIAHGAAEERRLLRDDADLLAERAHLHLRGCRGRRS